VTSNPDFKVTLLFNAEYFRNGTRYRHSYKRPCVTLNDLTKYSITCSIARFLCDSWARTL